jgi:hypothetical protein
MATRGRPRKGGELVRKQRRGVALMPQTLDRLNRFKVRLAAETRRPVSQDDAIAELLDRIEADNAPAAVPA